MTSLASAHIVEIRNAKKSVTEIKFIPIEMNGSMIVFLKIIVFKILVISSFYEKINFVIFMS